MQLPAPRSTKVERGPMQRAISGPCAAKIEASVRVG